MMRHESLDLLTHTLCSRSDILHRQNIELQTDFEIDHEFQKGDIVSRDGTDEHLVYTQNDGFTNIDVVCIKEPKTERVLDGVKWTSPYIEIGETETNLPRRYTFLRKSINMNELLKAVGREDLIINEKRGVE